MIAGIVRPLALIATEVPAKDVLNGNAVEVATTTGPMLAPLMTNSDPCAIPEEGISGRVLLAPLVTVVMIGATWARNRVEGRNSQATTTKSNQ